MHIISTFFLSLFGFLALSQNAYQMEDYQILDYRLDSSITVRITGNNNIFWNFKYHYTDDNLIKRIVHDEYDLIYDYYEGGYTETRLEKLYNTNVVVHVYSINEDGYTTKIEEHRDNENIPDYTLPIDREIFIRDHNNRILTYQKYLNMDIHTETLELYQSIHYSYTGDLLTGLEEIEYNAIGNEIVRLKTSHNYNERNQILYTESISTGEYEEDQRKEYYYYQYNEDGKLEEMISEIRFDVAFNMLVIKEKETMKYADQKVLKKEFHYNNDSESYELVLTKESHQSKNPFYPFEYEEINYYYNNDVFKYARKFDLIENEDENSIQVRNDYRASLGLDISSIMITKSFYEKWDNPTGESDTLIDISIFPNPVIAGNPIQLHGSSNTYNSYKIFSNDGRIVSDKTIEGKFQNTIEAPLNSGIYYIQLYLNERARSKWLKIIIL